MAFRINEIEGVRPPILHCKHATCFDDSCVICAENIGRGIAGAVEIEFDLEKLAITLFELEKKSSVRRLELITWDSCNFKNKYYREAQAIADIGHNLLRAKK